jgi:hypothetical protein
MVEVDKQANIVDDMQTVQSRIRHFGLSATHEDCMVIASTLAERRSRILQAFRSRSKARLNKAQREIFAVNSALNELRSQIWIDYQGNAPQTVEAQVVDPGLQQTIGETIQLRFPDRAWDPGRFRGDDVQVLMRGTYVSLQNKQIEAPLLVRFRQAKGTVNYTAFHNEAQNSEQELELLRYLVFSAVTAQEEALAHETMLSGGFSPVGQGQVNHAVGLDSITRKYLSTSGDPLRFSLSFGGRGATLRLKLVAPGGQEYMTETDETLIVEATGAPAGEWLYTVTSVKVPYENFAYSVSIGKGTAKPLR